MASQPLRLQLSEQVRKILRSESNGESLAPKLLPVNDALARCRARGVRAEDALRSAGCSLALEEHLPPPENPSEATLAFRKRLRERAAEREYEHLSADLRHDDHRDETSSVRAALGIGVHVMSIMGTLAAVGYHGGSRIIPHRPLTGKMAGMIVGIVLGLLIEIVLLVVRLSLPTPRQRNRISFIGDAANYGENKKGKDRIADATQTATGFSHEGKQRSGKKVKKK